MLVDLPSDWRAALAPELGSASFAELERFVDAERREHQVFPAEENVFRAFTATPFERVRVVLLGQDPYHGVGQAHGFCFSVPAGVPAPPSLKNIFKELGADLGLPLPAQGDLSAWATRGMLLLNTLLSVRTGEPLSHQKRGWERLTDAAISALSARARPVVFVLWGKPAEQKKRLVTGPQHRVVTAAHPSPLSAYRGFLGARPFSAIQHALSEVGEQPFDFSL
ncbi:MAG: uracil-DNA glycosylase [Myxococcales bacterium]